MKYSHKNSIKTIDIDSTIDVIYNGVACPDYELAMLSPRTGKIIYIENGSESDCVKVETYTNSIVSLADSERIYLKDGSKIEFVNFDEGKLKFFDKEGNAVDSVPVGAMLSLYYSDDNSVLKAVYSTDVIDNASVLRIYDEYIETDTEKLYINKLYLDWKSILNNFGNNKYRIYLDSYGEVAKIEKVFGAENFGYLLDVIKVGNFDRYFIKILLDNGDIDAIECSGQFENKPYLQTLYQRRTNIA